MDIKIGSQEDEVDAEYFWKSVNPNDYIEQDKSLLISLGEKDAEKFEMMMTLQNLRENRKKLEQLQEEEAIRQKQQMDASALCKVELLAEYERLKQINEKIKDELDKLNEEED